MAHGHKKGFAMRDCFCKEKDLKHIIDSNKRFIDEELIELEQLKDDLANGIQKYPIPTERIIFNTNATIFRMIMEMIRAKYSLGLQCDEIEKLYTQGIIYAVDIGYKEIGYVNILQFISLGVLFEISRDKMEILIKMIDEENVDDILLDCLVRLYGLKRKIHSSSFQREIPYREMMEIVEVASNDKEKASAMLKDYTETDWLMGHSDYGWTTAYKEVGYYGLWSFEAGAFAKILQIEDIQLKKSIHYPYDLTHYKNNMKFNKDSIKNSNKVSIETHTDSKEYIGGIPANINLEQIVPKKFHSIVNQIIIDYYSLNEREFWDKYKLNQIWFNFEDFLKEKKNGLLGTIIIFALVEKGYVLQIDYKEDINLYKKYFINYWNTTDTVLIRFELNNDQEYYAMVPSDYNLENVYEINISKDVIKKI